MAGTDLQEMRGEEGLVAPDSAKAAHLVFHAAGPVRTPVLWQGFWLGSPYDSYQGLRGALTSLCLPWWGPAALQALHGGGWRVAFFLPPAHGQGLGQVLPPTRLRQSLDWTVLPAGSGSVHRRPWICTVSGQSAGQQRLQRSPHRVADSGCLDVSLDYSNVRSHHSASPSCSCVFSLPPLYAKQRRAVTTCVHARAHDVRIVRCGVRSLACRLHSHGKRFALRHDAGQWARRRCRRLGTSCEMQNAKPRVQSWSALILFELRLRTHWSSNRKCHTQEHNALQVHPV